MVTPVRPARLYDAGSRQWHRDHRAGLWLVVGTTLLIVLVGLAGPSAVTLTVDPQGSWGPPWTIPGIHLPDWVAAGALYLAISGGALGLWVLVRAVSAGWRPRPWRLFALGAGLSTLVSLVPPMTSADVLMYAAYGRLQRLGLDPYQVLTGEIFRTQYDPVLKLTETPWQDTPSVYGPVLSFSQLLANILGGENIHTIVFWLQMMCLVPFLVIGVLGMVMARNNPPLQTRVVLFTVCNPVMIWAVVAQAHNEPLAVVFAVAALALLRLSPISAGIALGFAGATKVNMVLYGVAILWAVRRDRRALLQVIVGALLPLLTFYVLMEPQALLAAVRNTSYINAAGWASPVFGLLTKVMSDDLAKIIINAVALIGWLVIGTMLARIMPWRPLPGLPHDVGASADPLTTAVRMSAVLYVSWLVTTPNVFSWYDLMAWVPLALSVATPLDVLMIWRTTWLSLGFVTGRAITYTPSLSFTGARVRDVLSVAVQWWVLVSIVRWYRRQPRATTVAEPPPELMHAPE